MKWYFVILIVIGFYFLLGPLVWVSCKINKIDPFINERENLKELLKTKEGERSYLLVNIFRYLYTPLYTEKWIIDKIKKHGVVGQLV